MPVMQPGSIPSEPLLQPVPHYTGLFFDTELVYNTAIWVADDEAAWTEARLVSIQKNLKGYEIFYHTEEHPDQVFTDIKCFF